MKKTPLQAYLKYINPIVSLAVFLICLYAAMYEKGQYQEGSFYSGSIPTYFVAKGLFCGLALFLLGTILEVLLHSRACSQSKLQGSDAEEVT